ncbi:hypothetical protein [Legionella sp. WA2022007384]
MGETTAFFLEGLRTFKDGTGALFPEIDLTMSFAEINNAQIYDPIESYTVEQISQFLKTSSVEEQKIFVAYLLSTFTRKDNPNSEKNLEIAIKEAIIDPFEFLVENNYFDSIPTWVTQINPQNSLEFVGGVITQYFGSDEEQFKARCESYTKNIIAISNTISKENMIHYLKNNPQVQLVFGLFGRLHLPLLDEQGMILESNPNYRQIEVFIDDRKVVFHLFGGKHGSTEQLLNIITKAEQCGLVTEAPSKNPEAEIKSSHQKMESMMGGSSTASHFSIEHESNEQNRFNKSDNKEPDYTFSKMNTKRENVTSYEFDPFKDEEEDLSFFQTKTRDQVVEPPDFDPFKDEEEDLSFSQTKTRDEIVEPPNFDPFKDDEDDQNFSQVSPTLSENKKGEQEKFNPFTDEEDEESIGFHGP